MEDPFVLRVATADAAERGAALHAVSWRSAYRGSFSDAYLDGPVETERRSFWRERFQHPRAGFWTVLAEEADGVLQGFLCLLADHDPHWGTLIDNLHARPDRKGRGLGGGRGAGRRRPDEDPPPRPSTAGSAACGAIGS